MPDGIDNVEKDSKNPNVNVEFCCSPF